MSSDRPSSSERLLVPASTPSVDDSVEQNASHDQRSSRNRPCDACRRRKSRCVLSDGDEKCVLCKFYGQGCTFVEKIPPRKRRSATYENELERPSEDVKLRRLSKTVASPTDHITDVRDYADLKGPTLLKRTLGLQRRHHGMYLGPGGRFERSLMPKKQGLPNVKFPPNPSFRHVSSNEAFVLYPDLGTEMYENETADLDAIENIVAPHGRALIDLYFRIIHPSFPILHKKVYLEKYERSHREFSPALLAAVYILATTYWSYSPELSCSSCPSALLLERLAMQALSYAVHRPKLSTVEAGLLLLQRPGKASWPLTAQMVAVGQDLGLHRQCSEWDIPGWEKGLRRRLGWALFMQDKWASLVFGRPSHIFGADWVTQTLDDRDFPESVADEDDEEGSTEVVNGRLLFKSMTTLTIILSDILSALYSSTAEEKTAQESPDATIQVLMIAKPLQIRLKEWCAGLPACLDIEHLKVRKLSSSGYLHLAYWATEITLHRCIARTLPFCSDNHLVSICLSAASARSRFAMDFVKTLKLEHWQSFWYFASEYSFGLIGVFEILISRSICDDTCITESTAKLNEYRWKLKMAVQNAGFLEKSIAMLDLAVADSSVKRSKPMSGEICSEAGETRIDGSSHEGTEEGQTHSNFDNQLELNPWRQTPSLSTDDFQNIDDHVLWGQDDLFEMDFDIHQ